MTRCWGDGDPLLRDYHDREWGRPVRTEQGLYEKLCLEAFQAGLSWRTVLARRGALRAAFDGFDPDTVTAYGDADLARVLAADGVLRNRAKVRACVTNAAATVGLRGAGGLPALIWAHRPTVPPPVPVERADVPGSTPESVALARALKGAGFVFVGPTTAYALMQADGLVNDHLAGCDWRAQVQAAQDDLAADPAHG